MFVYWMHGMIVNLRVSFILCHTVQDGLSCACLQTHCGHDAGDLLAALYLYLCL